MPSEAMRPDPELPDIDDHLVEPETRYEMLDGELIYVSPAKYRHGRRHVQIAALVEAHVDRAFEVAADMLTRTSLVDDFAPDVSVFPVARDPQTGRRQLTQLAFEVVSAQSLKRCAVKAAKLAARGVRRVFAIDVERSRAFEWSRELDGWSVLAEVSCIEDPALAVPLSVELLIHAARTDDAVAHALLAKHNPVIESVRQHDREAGRAEGKIEGKIEGMTEGKIEALLALLAARQLALDDTARARITGELDIAQIDRWIMRAATCASVADLFAPG